MSITVTTAYVLSIVLVSALGWPIVGGVLWLIRKTIGHKDASYSLRVIDFWIGTTERIIAMSLVVWKPETLASFIGGKHPVAALVRRMADRAYAA